ncbi:MAG: M48 family metallopeptidase [Candidatus Omnitrophica bacterium]|nr:M48 family metallopeptidase [Candidatus Omnitrophota bacterium]
MNIYEQITGNNRATRIIVSVFILFFLFIGFGFDYYYGVGLRAPIFTVIALLFGLVSSYAGWRYGDKLILSSTHARELDLNDPKQKQWQNVVEEMSIASNMALPKTYIIDDPDPNAFATGRSPEISSIVVTRGLLEVLNRDEQQAVAAHEMSHIRNFDIRIMLMIAVLVGSIALISDWARRGLFRGERRSSRRDSGSGAAVLIILAIWLATVILAPLLSQIMAMFVSRRREYLADASGAELTRNPLALASALEKIDSRAEPTRSINQGSAHLCICDPKGRPIGVREGRLADLFATHPPINRRIEALKQMAYVA